MVDTQVEKNEGGAYLLNPTLVASECVSKFSRYNGGWVKRVEKLDKSKTNGYSLVGEFCKDVAQWMQPGVYLDCSKAGSRKNVRYIYTVFLLRHDGTAVAYNDSAVSVEGRGGDWAVRLWPVVERALAEVSDGSAKLAALHARREELLAELAKVEEEIKMIEEVE